MLVAGYPFDIGQDRWGKEGSAARPFGDNNELMGFGRIDKKVVGAGPSRKMQQIDNKHFTR